MQGCVNALYESQYPYTVFEVPGAVETVGFTQRLVATQKYSAVIIIGAIIKGDTDHYEYVCDYVVQGHALLATQAGIPLIFGILTTQNEELAFERAKPDKMNKGKEFAITAIEMIELFKKI